MSMVCSLRPIWKICLKQTVQGLNRVKANLHAQMNDLQNKKPRGKADEALLLEIERLQSSLLVTRDDLVGGRAHGCVCDSDPFSERSPAP